LALGAKGPEKFLFALEVSIGVISKESDTKGDIRGEEIIRVVGNELEKVEIPLHCKLPYIGIETEIPCILIGIFAVYITVTKLGIMSRYSHTYVIGELFAEENPDRGLGSVYRRPGIEITEVMGCSE
jgi:hypothetical protein